MRKWIKRLIGHFIGVIARRSNDGEIFPHNDQYSEFFFISKTSMIMHLSTLSNSVYKRLIGMTKEANESDDVSLKLKALDLIMYVIHTEELGECHGLYQFHFLADTVNRVHGVKRQRKLS